jgi:hypothetical protein
MGRRFPTLLILLASCQAIEEAAPGNTYGKDLAFLQEHDNSTLELRSSDGNSRVILSPRYQGRVMTTTSAGMEGTSYGWIKYDLIESGKMNKQFNPVGGEERFWLGPEGGQFSLYFAPGDSFKIEKWQVPPIIDTISYSVTARTDTSATFEAGARLVNYSGNVFDIGITRTVDLLSRGTAEAELDAVIHPSIGMVAYLTTNTITNAGAEPWTREKGLISIWLLGMFTPSPATTVIIPFAGSDPSQISTDYFGDIPPDRLIIRDGVLLFKCDGQYRSKIGLPPAITDTYAGSYDAEKRILTIIKFEVDRDGDYVNSKWEMQDEPFKGDAVNSYNDGPLEDGSQLGPFYELESSSAARPLQPGEKQTYKQITVHFEGDAEALNYLAQALLRVDLNTLNNPK